VDTLEPTTQEVLFAQQGDESTTKTMEIQFIVETDHNKLLIKK